MNWRSVVGKALLLGGLSAVALGVASTGAEARGFVGLSFGFPIYSSYAAPPPYYYAPPPVVYAPPPVTYAPPAYGYPAPAPAYGYSAPTRSYDAQCEPYESSTYIDGVPQTITGTACRQPDGTWRIVR